MIHVLLVTPDKDNLADLSRGMEIPDNATHWAFSGSEALEMIKTTSIDLVVTDEQLEDMTGLALVDKLVKLNPMVNCAAVSSLSKSEYHEASEGLGVLMQLPVRPNQEDGMALMVYLKKVLGFTAATSD